MSRSLKLIISLVLFVGITAGALAIIGGKKGRYSTNLLIQASPSQIFPYLRDHELRRKWNSHIVEIEATESGNNAVGVTSQTVMDEAGRHIKYSTTVIRYQENVSLTVQSENANKLLTSVYRLEDKGDGTTSLVYRMRTANLGLGRFMAVFNSKDWDEQIAENARKLKEVVESNPPAATTVAPDNEPPTDTSENSETQEGN